ncbi:MAG: rRNA adenine methyltransferase [Halobacteriovoraceae bacterium]|nr:rRNA adenine methyltransferase [Halobacteriovoraceae bacterium]|tara:strand:- start:15673 stop:16299 length:627 start_codon:yes stop_codon:yes gene_type:complete
MIDDGVIKFSFKKFQETPPLSEDEFQEIESCRKILFQKNLIGEYLPEKIGFGNISIKKDYSQYQKTKNPQFVITGTQTGGIESLSGQYYTRVVDFDLEQQNLTCAGPIKASSESLTHGAIYLADENIAAIVHIHSEKIWNEMLKANYPKTSKDTPYGTLEMAQEVQDLIEKHNAKNIVMEGHQDGVICIGSTIEEACLGALSLHERFI